MLQAGAVISAALGSVYVNVTVDGTGRVVSVTIVQSNHGYPDLDEVARDPAAGDIAFFRRIPKQLVASRVGPTWAPNFYYRSSSIQLLFLAPIARLRAVLPMYQSCQPW